MLQDIDAFTLALLHRITLTVVVNVLKVACALIFDLDEFVDEEEDLNHQLNGIEDQDS